MDVEELVISMQARIDAMENELVALRSLVSTTQIDLLKVEDFLDFNVGVAPLTESGKLTWDVIELRTQIANMDQKYFGKNIDAMVNI